MMLESMLNDYQCHKGMNSDCKIDTGQLCKTCVLAQTQPIKEDR
jgi:hypothetical protein